MKTKQKNKEKKKKTTNSNNNYHHWCYNEKKDDQFLSDILSNEGIENEVSGIKREIRLDTLLTVFFSFCSSNSVKVKRQFIRPCD